MAFWQESPNVVADGRGFRLRGTIFISRAEVRIVAVAISGYSVTLQSRREVEAVGFEAGRVFRQGVRESFQERAMWCPSCRADAASELSADARHLHCARCQTNLGLTAASMRVTGDVAVPGASQEAVDLLARWSAETLLEPKPSDRPEAAAESEPTADTVTAGSIRPLPPPQRPPRPSNAAASATTASSTAVPRQPRSRRRRASTLSQNWVAGCGQFAAYLGVLLLTCGTAIVIASHFGNAPRPAVSGWLLAAVGQMLLFLGVITLVASGLEQTRLELRRRLVRIEKRLRRAESSAASSSVRPQSPRRAA